MDLRYRSSSTTTVRISPSRRRCISTSHAVFSHRTSSCTTTTIPSSLMKFTGCLPSRTWRRSPMVLICFVLLALYGGYIAYLLRHHSLLSLIDLEPSSFHPSPPGPPPRMVLPPFSAVEEACKKVPFIKNCSEICHSIPLAGNATSIEHVISVLADAFVNYTIAARSKVLELLSTNGSSISGNQRFLLWKCVARCDHVLNYIPESVDRVHGGGLYDFLDVGRARILMCLIFFKKDLALKDYIHSVFDEVHEFGNTVSSIVEESGMAYVKLEELSPTPLIVLRQRTWFQQFHNFMWWLFRVPFFRNACHRCFQ